ncbi:MAG: hypothetical protein AB8H12_16105 [Lewinella sp.]
MKDQDSKLIQALENRIEKSKYADTIVSVFKAIVATTGVGSGIASLISDVIPSARFIRLEKFTNQLAEEFNTFQGEIDESYLRTEEFGFIFEKCYKGVAENYQKEKIEAFKSILINSLVGNCLVQDEKEYFLNLTNSLSALNIKILKFLAHPKEYLKANRLSDDIIRGGFRDIFVAVFPDIDIGTLKFAFGDLHSMGFINTDKSIFSSMTASRGWDLLPGRVNEYGEKYIDFITLG